MAQKVKFKRHTTAEIEELEVEDGALVYNVDNGKTYMDYGTERIQTGGNADTMISIGDEEPTDEDIKIWINTPTSETKASEIVNEYTDSDKVGYSTRYMNTALQDVYSTNEIKTNKVWIDNKPIYRKSYTGNTVKSNRIILESNSSIDNIISAYGSATSMYDWCWTIPNVASGYEVYCRMTTNTRELQLYCGSNFTTSNVYVVTVEYTKTTDQGGV